MTRPYATIARDPVLRAAALRGCPPSERKTMEAALAAAGSVDPETALALSQDKPPKAASTDPRQLGLV